MATVLTPRPPTDGGHEVMRPRRTTTGRVPREA
jgi:hypothetical protein